MIMIIINNNIGDIEKKTWQATIPRDQQWQKYIDSYKESLTRIDEANKYLEELSSLLYSADFCTEGITIIIIIIIIIIIVIIIIIIINILLRWYII